MCNCTKNELWRKLMKTSQKKFFQKIFKKFFSKKFYGQKKKFGQEISPKYQKNHAEKNIKNDIAARKIKIFIIGLQETNSMIIPDPLMKYLRKCNFHLIVALLPTTFTCTV